LVTPCGPRPLIPVATVESLVWAGAHSVPGFDPGCGAVLIEKAGAFGGCIELAILEKTNQGYSEIGARDWRVLGSRWDHKNNLPMMHHRVVGKCPHARPKGPALSHCGTEGKLPNLSVPPSPHL
jgi:hypothetical protein